MKKKQIYIRYLQNFDRRLDDLLSREGRQFMDFDFESFTIEWEEYFSEIANLIQLYPDLKRYESNPELITEFKKVYKRYYGKKILVEQIFYLLFHRLPLREFIFNTESKMKEKLRTHKKNNQAILEYINSLE